MPKLQEAPEIVTSDEFVSGVLCALALRKKKKIKLGDTLEDTRFQAAFEDLLEHSAELQIYPSFSLATNLFHGDSSTLRETLYAMRERGIVAINNPSFRTVEFRLSDEDAAHIIGRSSIPARFFEELVERHFIGEAPLNDEGDGNRASCPA